MSESENKAQNFEGILLHAEFIYVSLFLHTSTLITNYIYEQAVAEFSAILEPFYIIQQMDFSLVPEPDLLPCFLTDYEIMDNEKPTCLIIKNFTQTHLDYLNSCPKLFWIGFNGELNQDINEKVNYAIFQPKLNHIILPTEHIAKEMNPEIEKWISENIIHALSQGSMEIMQKHILRLHQGIERLFTYVTDMGCNNPLEVLEDFNSVERELILLSTPKYYGISFSEENLNDLSQSLGSQNLDVTHADEQSLTLASNEISCLPKKNSIPSSIIQEFDQLNQNEMYFLVFCESLTDVYIPPLLKSEITRPLELYSYLRLNEWSSEIPSEFLTQFFHAYIREIIKTTPIETSQIYEFLIQEHRKLCQFLNKLCPKPFHSFENIDAGPIITDPAIQKHILPDNAKTRITQFSHPYIDKTQKMNAIPNFVNEINMKNNSVDEEKIGKTINKNSPCIDENAISVKGAENFEFLISNRDLEKRYNKMLEFLHKKIANNPEKSLEILKDYTNRLTAIWIPENSSNP